MDRREWKEIEGEREEEERRGSGTDRVPRWEGKRNSTRNSMV
jgi:hypothetical protein